MDDLLARERHVRPAFPRMLVVERLARDVRRKEGNPIEWELPGRLDDLAQIEVVHPLYDAAPRDLELGAAGPQRAHTGLELVEGALDVPDSIVHAWAAVERHDHLVAPLRHLLRVG